jgi:hypothetical protein
MLALTAKPLITAAAKLLELEVETKQATEIFILNEDCF